MTTDPFFVVAREHGLGGTMLPTWSDRDFGTSVFRGVRAVTRTDLPAVPGAFQLLGVLDSTECSTLLDVTERLGFHSDSPVSLPRAIRHNDNLNWVVSESIDAAIWDRCEPLIPETVDGRRARGLNARFRFYRYGPGDFFKPHTDGSWPGSRVVGERLITDADPRLRSEYTYLIFLNDDFDGGETEFLVSRADPSRPARRGDDVDLVPVRTPAGGVLCFPHGMHPQHCLHSSAPITRGVKTIIRTDILFGP